MNLKPYHFMELPLNFEILACCFGLCITVVVYNFFLLEYLKTKEVHHKTPLFD